MRRYCCLLVIAAVCIIMTSKPSVLFAEALTGKEGVPKVLSLQTVLNQMQKSPVLRALEKNIDIQNGIVKQAGLLPNPEISIEIENFEGENSLEGFDGAETTIAVSQLIELGGKWGSRKKVARQEMTIAELDFQIQQQDLYLETFKAFFAALASQEKLIQTEHLLGLAAQGYQTVSDRVEAGKVSPVHEMRARVELSMARNTLAMAKKQLAQTRQTLSALWGDPTPDFGEVSGDFDVLSELPDWQIVQAAFSNNPDVKRWESELSRKRAKLRLEQSNSIPDVTFSFGVRTFRETDDEAFVAGVAFPFPLFGRNQGGRMAAQSELSQAFYQRDAEVARLSSELRFYYQELLATYNQARTIQQEIMPAAEEANEAAQIGYQAGKFDFLEALDAQRTLFEVKAQYIDAFSAYHEARLSLMRLAGGIDRDTTI